MKRLAVAFHSRREQSSEPPRKRNGFISKPELNVPNNTYSSSSSDGSVVQTPEPEEELRALPPTQRWTSWIRSKPAKPKSPPPPPVWLPSSSDSHPATRLPIPQPETTLDSDDSDSSDHYEEDDPPPSISSPPSRPSHSPSGSSRVLQPATQLRAQMNMRAISLSSLIPPLSPPPLLHLPSSPLFPRSSNQARSLKRLQTTRTILHKTTLLRRLEGQSLTREDHESIAAFGHRPKHVVPKTRRPSGIDEDAMSDVRKVRFHSKGLRVWLDRPHFEERCVQWRWDAARKAVVLSAIVGSDKAVASLEFSEGLEALAGYPLTIPLPPPILSPLRITSPPPHTESLSAGSITPNPSTGPTTPTTAIPLSATPRKILRFLPDPDPEDKEDNVPLGYQVQTKKERERLAEERAREEERMKKVYAAEVVAARARREGERSGSMHEMGIVKAKDRRQSYLRTAYDPASTTSSRRMASEPDTRPRPQSLPRPPSTTDVNMKSRPSSIRSERLPHSSQILPPSPPSIQSGGDVDEAKRRRRQSNLSEGAGSTRSRTPSAPAAAPPRSSMYPRTMPRSHSSGPGSSGMSMMPMPVPPMPVMPMFVTPQYFVPQMHMQAQMQLQAQMQQHPPLSPLLPPKRPGLPVSRSAEGLVPPQSRRREPSGSSFRPPSMPRSVSNGDDAKRASRMSIQVPPVSYKSSSGPSPREHRPTPPSR